MKNLKPGTFVKWSSSIGDAQLIWFDKLPLKWKEGFFKIHSKSYQLNVESYAICTLDNEIIDDSINNPLSGGMLHPVSIIQIANLKLQGLI